MTADAYLCLKDEIVQVLTESRWGDMYSLPTGQSQFDYFHRVLVDIMNGFAPVEVRTFLSNKKPWISDNFRTLSAKRQHARMSGDPVQQVPKPGEQRSL